MKPVFGKAQSAFRAGNITFSGAQKYVLLKPSSGERRAPRNFVLLITL